MAEPGQQRPSGDHSRTRSTGMMHPGSTRAEGEGESANQRGAWEFSCVVWGHTTDSEAG